ncbi:MAG: hypothetical protein U1F29_07340 [Planctomycetota bacterium]
MLIAFVQSVVLSGATVHTLVPGESPRPLEILVQDGKITALAAPGAADAFPKDARRVDVTGLHALPGLIDALVNHDPEQDRLYVASGVALVCDQGGDLSPAIAERALAARDRWPGPTLATAGAPLVGVGARAGIVLESADAAKEKLGRLLGETKLDWIALGPDLGAGAWKKALEVAHEKGLRVFGPVLANSTLTEALDAGQDGVYHVDALLPAGKAWSEVVLADLLPRVEKLAASKTVLVPTLALHAVQLLPQRPDAPELQHLGPFYVQQWVSDAAQREHAFASEKGAAYRQAGLQALNLQQELLRAAWEKKVRLVPGSASPRPWLFPGRALVEELVLWGRAGIAPSDVVRAATVGAAEAFGFTDRGTLAAGKVADVGFYLGDPERDLAVLRDPRVVVLRGKVLDRGALDGLVQDLKTRQQAQAERAFGKQPIELDAPSTPEGAVLARGAVEERVFGVRAGAERYAIVRGTDGAVTYATHLRTFGGIAKADTDVALTQTVRDGRVAAFELTVKSGVLEVVTKGVLVGNVLNVERRANGQFVGNVPVKDKVVLVDVGSVLAAFQVAHDAREGTFKALFFDDYEPAVGPWELRVDEKRTLLTRTQSGFLAATLGDDGALTDLKREQGRGVADFDATSGELPSGAWPVPEENRVPSKPAAQPR